MAVPGKSYQVNYKSDLTDTEWAQAPGIISVVGTQASFSVPLDQSGRFYVIESQ
jgi:hypothetical protein